MVANASYFTEFNDEPELAMPTVIRRTREELLAQRQSLLAEVNMSYSELTERAETYSLSMDELDVWHTVEGLDYLLAGDDC
ncbi:hypothetical protein MTQ01_02890 [Streptomyces sp. XM4193]|uniref:hypothetical protein n=1 Tax=Streptomyces sp. XM4193 TaxID=2929782 RepID=UPI001FFBF462|nr:hypothetical protein [Streptomyces sp. XM4193]MCK1794984.1 hypothetical protein [Streptomyces sp. XM4193]